MNTVTSWGYIRENYRPTDRLAVVIKHQAGPLLQRIRTAEQMVEPNFQRWLRYQNASQSGNIYLSANILKPEATGRRCSDVAGVRHVYLDIDKEGDKVLRRILYDAHVPQPNYVLNTSPGKYQTVWKVEGFSIAQAESLQRTMAVTFGADRAVVDAARVLRWPGFKNRKYDPPHRVIAERLCTDVFRPQHFQVPTPIVDEPVLRRMPRAWPRGPVSQSERDWAETMRRLGRGEDPIAVRTWLEDKRQDKQRPSYYAEITVRKAVAELERRRQATTVAVEFD